VANVSTPNTCGDRKPAGYASVPGFPRVRVVFGNTYDGDGRDMIVIRYYGTAADLVLAGVVTADMLAPGRRQRVDAEGHRFCQDSYYMVDVGRQPHRIHRVSRWKPAELVGQLPGALAAIAAHEELGAWLKAVTNRLTTAASSCHSGSLQAPKSGVRPTHLRLVVGNE